MTQQKKNFSGIKIAQQPGGSSSFSLDWGHKEEPVKKPTMAKETNNFVSEQ